VRLSREGALASTLGIRVKSDANGYEKIIAHALGEIPEPDSDAIVGEREAAGEPVAAAIGWGGYSDEEIPF